MSFHTFDGETLEPNLSVEELEGNSREYSVGVRFINGTKAVISQVAFPDIYRSRKGIISDGFIFLDRTLDVFTIMNEKDTSSNTTYIFLRNLYRDLDIQEIYPFFCVGSFVKLLANNCADGIFVLFPGSIIRCGVLDNGEKKAVFIVNDVSNKPSLIYDWGQIKDFIRKEWVPGKKRSQIEIEIQNAKRIKQRNLSEFLQDLLLTFPN